MVDPSSRQLIPKVCRQVDGFNVSLCNTQPTIVEEGDQAGELQPVDRVTAQVVLQVGVGQATQPDVQIGPASRTGKYRTLRLSRRSERPHRGVTAGKR